MADLPITFSGPMVRAILREIEQPGAGKTQTRRGLKPVGSLGNGWPMYPQYINGKRSGDTSHPEFCDLTSENSGVPLYSGNTPICPGDRLYVREHWRTFSTLDDVAPRDLLNDRPGATIAYLADNSGAFYSKPPVEGWQWFQQGIDFAASGRFRQAMHMPKWASRITLIVTDVRVERLQDCSEADALAEGIDRIHFPERGDWGWPQRAYAKLWDDINGPGAWEANPWVVAYTFRPVLGNIDQIGNADG